MRGLAILSAMLAAAVAATAAYAAARPVDPRDRALLARPATPEERIAEQVADRLTRHRVSVRCGSLHEASPYLLGVTPFLNGRPFDYFLMRPAECTYLAWFRQSPERWDPRTCTPSGCAVTLDVVWALDTVAHESYHLLGYRNEAQVECYGLQSIWFVATSLGAPLPEAQALAALFATRIYPERRLETPSYWSPECRDGGRYDLRPRSPAWPS